MSVTVRNMNPKSIMVLSSRDKAVDSIEWKAAGDRDGEDVQMVPEDMIKGAKFLRAVGIGLLRIEDGDEAFQESIAKQAARYARAESAATDAIEEIVDSNSQYGVIRITEDQLNTHIANLSKNQPSELSDIGETSNV